MPSGIFVGQKNRVVSSYADVLPRVRPAALLHEEHGADHL